MWRKLFNAPWPDDDNLLPLAVQQQAAARIRAYWIGHGWQLVLGELILWVAAIYQGVPASWVYGVLALLIGGAYLIGFLPYPVIWLMFSSALLLAQGMAVQGLGPVTALTFIVPYTFAGMLLAGRGRVVVQIWCMLGFWAGLIYGVLPILPQLKSPNYLLISYDILLAVYIFQTLRFLNHLTVEINSVYVTGEIRGQSQQFLARVSHELRTPLNSVLGFAKLMWRGDLTETQINYLSQIIEEGEQLNHLVSDLLDSAHLSTGKLTLRLEECDLNTLCRAVIEEHKAVIPPSITFKTELAPQLPSISADQTRLRQAVSNLVSNAVKYTPEGAITVRTYQHNHRIYIQVQDTGIGIPEAQQSMVFIPFVQLDSRHIGVGLGLDIALQIARLHGGDLHLTSNSGGGSTFTIELPINH
jgi:signal transduction histidine kinase